MRTSLTDAQIIEMASDMDNWVAIRDFTHKVNGFTYAQLKVLFWKAEEHPGLETCTRIVGKKRYINLKLFGAWLAGLLPEQSA